LSVLFEMILQELKPKPQNRCALTVTEVSLLKSLVRETDPQAFVIVSPAQEILGKGFTPLDEIEIKA